MALLSESMEMHMEDVKLQWADGFTATIRLKVEEVDRLKRGDSKFMNELRKNIDACTAATSQNAQGNTEEECLSEPSDVEEAAPVSDHPSYTHWPREAILLLISLYKDHEDYLEKHTHKKKDTWKIITDKMNKAGYTFNQNKVESKWRSLIHSHKDIILNKKKTGGKRKGFQYFQELEAIIAKKHDVNPPVLGGSGMPTKIRKIVCDDKMASAGEEKFTIEALSSSESSSTELSQSKSAQTRREKRKQQPTAATVASETLSFLKSVEEQRKAEHKEREEKKDSRATERNEILKEFSLLDLPNEILFNILQQTEQAQLYSVCTKLKDLVYSTRTKMIIAADALNDNCGLFQMTQLKELTIMGSNHDDCVMLINTCTVLDLPNLTSLTLVSFDFNEHFEIVVEGLSKFKLVAFVCKCCAKVSVQDVKYVLHKLPSIKYCIVDVTLPENYENQVKELADIINTYAGRVNFSLQNLDLLPQNHLNYTYDVYRCWNPQGMGADDMLHS